MKIKIVLVMFIAVVILFYGRQPKLIVDDIEMPAVAGLDYVNKDTIQITEVLPIYKPDKTVVNKILSAKGGLSKETVGKLRRKTSRRIENGKLESIVFSKKIARHGIADTLDSLFRDPIISEKIYLTVSDGEAKTLLNKQYSEIDNGVYLSELIEHNIETGLLPKTNFHYFLSAYFSKIGDPFLPLIQKEGNAVNIKGIALFKGDRYVKTLGQNSLFAFKALIENITLGAYKVKLNKSDAAFIESVYTKQRFTIQNKNGTPKIDIRLNVKGNIRQFTGGKLDGKEITKIEKKMNQQLEKQATTMIRMFQKLKIDPIGLGEEVRSRTRNFNSQKWLDQYPNVKIIVKVHTSISEKGVAG